MKRFGNHDRFRKAKKLVIVIRRVVAIDSMIVVLIHACNQFVIIHFTGILILSILLTLVAVCYLRFTIHYSLFTIHYSIFTIFYSLFLFVTRYTFDKTLLSKRKSSSLSQGGVVTNIHNVHDSVIYVQFQKQAPRNSSKCFYINIACDWLLLCLHTLQTCDLWPPKITPPYIVNGMEVLIFGTICEVRSRFLLHMMRFNCIMYSTIIIYPEIFAYYYFPYIESQRMKSIISGKKKVI